MHLMILLVMFAEKEFLVVPSYSVIDLDVETQEFEEIEPACITEWQNQKF